MVVFLVIIPSSNHFLVVKFGLDCLLMGTSLKAISTWVVWHQCQTMFVIYKNKRKEGFVSFSKQMFTVYCSYGCRYKLKNIEETEAAKKLLQEKRIVGKSKSEYSIPSSYSADYFQRGRDYAEKLRRGCFHFPFSFSYSLS